MIRPGENLVRLLKKTNPEPSDVLLMINELRGIFDALECMVNKMNTTWRKAIKEKNQLIDELMEMPRQLKDMHGKAMADAMRKITQEETK